MIFIVCTFFFFKSNTKTTLSPLMKKSQLMIKVLYSTKPQT